MNSERTITSRHSECGKLREFWLWYENAEWDVGIWGGWCVAMKDIDLEPIEEGECTCVISDRGQEEWEGRLQREYADFDPNS